MGIENRSYYRDDAEYGQPRQFGSTSWSMISIIIAINVAVFVLDTFIPVGQILALRSDRVYFVWNWLTYGFTHAPFESSIGIWHILGNMVTLFFLGRAVEQRMGPQEFLSFYLVAVVVSGLGAVGLAWLSGSTISLVGASGAVTAVVVLFIMWFPHQKLLIWGILPVPAWLLGVIMIASNLGYAFSPGSQVSWQAHAMGAVFGFLYLKNGWRFGPLGMDRLKDLSKNKPKLKLHDPDAKTQKLQAEADRILAKINQSGEGSLTSGERRTLNKYSQSLRKRRDDS
ncbi:rhomboid family intramembrane serine protease [Mariniblastus sp.]|nr:rhomboid family intramembrane serine protease [Mariniblastus sp.]